MSMKKFELEKNKGLKIDGKMKAAGVQDRFAQGAGTVAGRREQRRRDSAAGLVPFACKLPAELVRQLSERAAVHEGGMNGLVAQLLEKALP
jgi:hypothetical protein